MLKDKAILIIEDNIFLALDLSSLVEDFNGRVVGPTGSVAEALTYLENEEIAAAVLDCEIADHEVTQVVMVLAEKGIPVVIHAISEPPSSVFESLPDAPIFMAPIQSRVVLARLIDEIARRVAMPSLPRTDCG